MKEEIEEEVVNEVMRKMEEKDGICEGGKGVAGKEGVQEDVKEGEAVKDGKGGEG